uniref:MACPF domain-containing protein n=1 Tax=Aegilops tauschii subsp. strangulata TaxID=200361 RepID=A0A453PIM5_AEGTS
AASSPLSPAEIRGHLDRLGDELFSGACAVPPPHARSRSKLARTPEAFNVFDAQVAQQRLQGITTLVSSKEGVTVIYSKRGGNTTVSSHAEWLPTVPAAPDVINAKLVPITSLLRGVAGTGFLSHAINLYLRYKPPLADLRYFLDFQHHRMWAPVLGELPLGPCSNRQGSGPALHFSLLGSKLYVSSSQVVVSNLPVTGMRLHLEGKKNNRARHPPAAPVGHADVHRRRAGAGRHAAGVAGLRGGHRRPPLLRAGAVADVRARLHRAGQVRPAVAPLPLRRRRRPPRRLRRDRRAAPRHGARLHHRAAPPAALLGAARLRRRAVQVGARRGEDGVGEVAVVVELPVHALLGVVFVVVVRWRWRPEARAPAGGGEHQLRRVRRRAAGARGRAEAAQVRGHLAGDHGPARQPRVLARHRRQARRRQGQDLAARQVLPARPVAFLTVTESVQFSSPDAKC